MLGNCNQTLRQNPMIFGSAESGILTGSAEEGWSWDEWFKEFSMLKNIRHCCYTTLALLTNIFLLSINTNIRSLIFIHTMCFSAMSCKEYWKKIFLSIWFFTEFRLINSNTFIQLCEVSHCELNKKSSSQTVFIHAFSNNSPLNMTCAI